MPVPDDALLESPAPAAPVTRPSEEPCLNCGTAMTEVYCPACGQKRSQRLQFRSLIKEALQRLTQLDSKFARTLIGMTLRPGQTARAYVEGRRGLYLNPIKYTFLTTTVFLLLINVFDIEVWRLRGGGREGFMLIFGLLSYLIFFNVLGPATVQRIVFRNRGMNLAECYVCMLFSYGHIVLFFSIAALLGAYHSFTSYLVIPIGTLLYLAWVLFGFYRTRLWWAVLTAFVMVPAYYVVGAVGAFVIQFLYVLLM